MLFTSSHSKEIGIYDTWKDHSHACIDTFLDGMLNIDGEINPVNNVLYINQVYDSVIINVRVCLGLYMMGRDPTV